MLTVHSRDADLVFLVNPSLKFPDEPPEIVAGVNQASRHESNLVKNRFFNKFGFTKNVTVLCIGVSPSVVRLASH